MEVSPSSGHRAGGSIITVTVSDACSLQLTDDLNCIFDGIPVTASYENGTAATCVMPLINNTGIIPFVFEVKRGGSRVIAPMDFESRECMILYTDCTHFVLFTPTMRYACIFMALLFQYPASYSPLHLYHQLEATCLEELQSPSPLPVNA